MNEIIYYKTIGCYECKYVDKALKDLKQEYNFSIIEKVVDEEYDNVIKSPALIFRVNGITVYRIEKLVGTQHIEKIINKYFE